MKLGKGMRYRILRMNLMLMIPLLVLFSAASLTSIYNLMRSSTVDLLTSESQNSQIYLMEQLAHRWEPEEQLRELRSSAAAFSQTLSTNVGMRVQIYSSDGELLGDSSLTAGVAPTQDVSAAIAGTKAYTFFLQEGKPYISFSSPIFFGNITLGSIRYLGLQQDLSLILNFSLVLLCFTLFATVICFVMSVFVANSFSQPILALRDAARKAGEDLNAPLESVQSADSEVVELEQAFNAMHQANLRSIQRLADEKERQNLFFNSATHQLKTPLTSIIGYSDIIKRMSDDDDIQQGADYIEKAGKDLLAVVEDIISISRFQKTEYEFDPEWFCLDELCDECTKLLAPRLQRAGISLVNSCTPIEVFFDRQRVREVILNVLDNSILHSGCTQISVSSGSLPLRLMINDNGKGLEEEQQKRIFEPFYRPTGSLHGGSGLGLSICKGIMTAQGGDVEVTSSPEHGTEVVLYFQKNDGRDSQPHHMARRI